MPRYRLICLQIADQQYHELPDGVRELIDHGMAVAGPGGLDVPVHAEANGGRAWSDGSGRLLVRHVAATAVVIGTEATSPMLPTSVRTISVATSSVVTMSPSAHPEMLKISIGGSDDEIGHGCAVPACRRTTLHHDVRGDKCVRTRLHQTCE